MLEIICWSRTSNRGRGDDHLAYREAMEKIYLTDDQDAFVQYMRDQGIPVLVVNNEADGEEHLKTQVEELVRDLF